MTFVNTSKDKTQNSIPHMKHISNKHSVTTFYILESVQYKNQLGNKKEGELIAQDMPEVLVGLTMVSTSSHVSKHGLQLMELFEKD